jgi:hypothetical protein
MHRTKANPSDGTCMRREKRVQGRPQQLPLLFLGYEKGSDGGHVIVEEETVIVRRIFI